MARPDYVSHFKHLMHWPADPDEIRRWGFPASRVTYTPRPISLIAESGLNIVTGALELQRDMTRNGYQAAVLDDPSIYADVIIVLPYSLVRFTREDRSLIMDHPGTFLLPDDLIPWMDRTIWSDRVCKFIPR